MNQPKPIICKTPQQKGRVERAALSESSVKDLKRLEDIVSYLSLAMYEYGRKIQD
jgi:hypothetical protein